MNSQSIKTSFLSLLLCVGIAMAAIVAPQSIKYLITTSDAIVVGTLSGDIVQGKGNFLVHVTRPLKGEIRAADAVSVVWNGSRLASGHIEPVTGLFFLKRTSEAWNLMPAMNGDVHFDQTFFQVGEAGKSRAPASTENLRVEEKVFVELLDILDAGPMKGANAFVDLAAVYRDFKSPVMGRMLSDYSGATTRVSSVALRSQLMDGDLRGLQRLERDQRAIAESPVFRNALEDLRSYRSSDPAGVEILGRLATSSAVDLAIRQASAGALANIHTPPTLPILASLLDSQDTRLQSYATGGLAMFANNVPIGSYQPAAGDWSYRTEETIAHSAMDERLVKERPAYYIGFWKAWWAENRAKLGY